MQSYSRRSFTKVGAERLSNLGIPFTIEFNHWVMKWSSRGSMFCHQHDFLLLEIPFSLSWFESRNAEIVIRNVISTISFPARMIHLVNDAANDISACAYHRHTNIHVVLRYSFTVLLFPLVFIDVLIMYQTYSYYTCVIYSRLFHPRFSQPTFYNLFLRCWKHPSNYFLKLLSR